MHLLVSTLGTTWPVIPELYAMFSDWYGKQTIAAPPPDAIWIISTEQAWTCQGDQLQRWSTQAGTAIEAFLLPCKDLENQHDVAAMRELIFRVVLQASETATQLSCSLAGGRKTMSADMQEAAGLFGCRRLLHILANGESKNWPAELLCPVPNFFSRPLPAACRHLLVPIVLPGHDRADLLDVHWHDHPPVHSERFPPQAITDTQLCDEIAARRRDTGLLSNFISAIERDEHHENWRGLYRLPPRLIDRLRATVLGPEHADLLRTLPKADLHHHIGGSLDLDEQRLVAEAIWQELPATSRDRAIALVRALDWKDPAAGWRQRLKQDGDRAHNCAAVFMLHSDDQLQDLLYPQDRERVALSKRDHLGFAAYEIPGELSGSAVLGHPASLIPTARAIHARCRRDGIVYLELRGSPHKYRPHDPIAWLRDLRQALADHMPADQQHLIRFIWIIDRRLKDQRAIADIVRRAATARDTLQDFLVGLDLAGDEQVASAAELAPAFIPAFEACLPITIHAGEGVGAESIWQAAYHLHADRIGHGLSLVQHAQLLQRFRDRGICLELCPTSNREVVGFRDPDHPASRDCADYPLRQLWASGVPLTLCTDNPGISRCTLHGEYLSAARMIGGLPLWDALAMMKRAFVHAFTSAETRARLLTHADRCMHDRLIQHLQGTL